MVVAHGLSCSTACGIFLDQGSNPRPLHWQADSQPLRHQGSPPGGALHILFRLLLESHALCPVGPLSEAANVTREKFILGGECEVLDSTAVRQATLESGTEGRTSSTDPVFV